MSALGLFLSVLVSGDAALTLPLPLQPRDAIVARSMDDRQLHLFLPRDDGSFELRALPPLPSRVTSMALVDADDDRDLDLALLLEDGQVVLWDGNGKGEFVSHEASGAEIHAHHAHEILIPALTPAQDKDLRTLLRESLARRQPARPLPAEVPAGFLPLAVVSGRFASGGTEQLAVVGAGARPRLALVRGSAMTEVLSPNVTHTVFVGQGGQFFSPDEVNAQPGDTVHWVWSSLGHNVVSGNPCTNNNLFCSPNNTNCAANPTSSPGAFYDRVFSTAGTFPYFCRPHCLFGMTGTIFVAAAPGGILEATNLRISRSGLNTTFSYTAACGATSHAIYSGNGPIAGSLVWSSGLCIDASGSHTADIGNPTGLQYFVVVGRTATAEGSYGKSSANVERPEASGVGTCDLPRQISATCP